MVPHRICQRRRCERRSTSRGTAKRGAELGNLHAVQVVGVLKKEIMKTQSKDLEKGPEYRQLLVQAIHSCAVKFPDVAGGTLPRRCLFSACTNLFPSQNQQHSSELHGA